MTDFAIGTVTRVRFPATQVPSSGANDLDDYEELTWTPTDASGAALSFSSALGTYEKVGRQVTARLSLTYPATADASAAKIGGLPFTSGSGLDNAQGFISVTNYTGLARCDVINSSTTVELTTNADAAVTNANMSGKYVRLTVIYRV